MNNELIKVCMRKISEYDELIRNVNKKINRLRPIYDKLCPKGRKFDSNDDARILKICGDDELIDKMYDILKDDCPFLLEVMVENQKKYDEYSEYTDKELLKRGLTKEILYSQEVLERLRINANNDPLQKQIYDKIIMMKENDKKLFELSRDIVLYVINYIIDLYNNYLSEKEELKEKAK